MTQVNLLCFLFNSPSPKTHSFCPYFHGQRPLSVMKLHVCKIIRFCPEVVPVSLKNWWPYASALPNACHMFPTKWFHDSLLFPSFLLGKTSILSSRQESIAGKANSGTVKRQIQCTKLFGFYDQEDYLHNNLHLLYFQCLKGLTLSGKGENLSALKKHSDPSHRSWTKVLKMHYNHNLQAL